MSPETMQILMTGATIALGAFGPALAMGWIGRSTIEAISRNPETENAVRTTMVLGLAFVESLAIFSLVMALIIKFS